MHLFQYLQGKGVVFTTAGPKQDEKLNWGKSIKFMLNDFFIGLKKKTHKQTRSLADQVVRTGNQRTTAKLLAERMAKMMLCELLEGGQS